MPLLFQRGMFDIIHTVTHWLSVCEDADLALLLLLSHRFLKLCHLLVPRNDIGWLLDDGLFIALCAKVTLVYPNWLVKSFTITQLWISVHINELSQIFFHLFPLLRSELSHGGLSFFLPLFALLTSVFDLDSLDNLSLVNMNIAGIMKFRLFLSKSCPSFERLEEELWVIRCLIVSIIFICTFSLPSSIHHKSFPSLHFHLGIQETASFILPG